MPRGSAPSTSHQLVKALVIGDGKCGKSDWAARAAEAGFNVLYLDADVGSQTIAGLPKDPKNPVKPEVMDRIFILNVGDELINGGLNYRFVKMFKKFCTASPTYRWNDTESREYVMADDKESGEIWEIKPGKMDHTCVLAIDSWTSLVQSCMNWAAEELGIDLQEVSEEERKKMRSVYQAAGEKLTYYLQMIRSAPCHVIVIAHPAEFTKTKKPDGKTIAGAKEGDLTVLWTKMVPKSSSNNHAMTMAKYFTDLAWLEVDAMGNYKIDYRANNERISGSHLNARLDCRGDGSFAKLVEQVGGTIPGSTQPFDHWLTIHPSGLDVAAKPALVLGGKSESPAQTAQPVKGLTLNKPGLNLSKVSK